MNRKLAGLAAGAVLALAAGVLGAANASAATVTTPETTAFTCSAGSPALLVDASNVVPARGTAVTFDLEFAISTALASTLPSNATIAADVDTAISTLEAAPYNVPAADFSNAPVGDVLPPAGTGTTVTLYAVGATKTSFELSGVKGGVAVNAGAVFASEETTAPCAGSVSWNEVTAAKVVRPYVADGHVISVDNNRAQVGWTYGPGVSCALVRIFGYGFTLNGSPHTGFTCSDIGYLEGLAAGHGYDLQVVPANPVTRQPLPNAAIGYVYVLTTR